MPQTHKRVRDAVESAMRDNTGGFNTRLAEALPSYGIAPGEELPAIALNWSPESANVLYARMGSGDFRLTTLDGRLTLEMAPDGSQYTGETPGILWSGIVGLRLIFRVRYSFRGGDETPPEDSAVVGIAMAIEDAVIDVIRRHRDWPDEVILSRPPDCPEGYILEPLEDGCEVTIPMRVGFKVDVNY